MKVPLAFLVLIAFTSWKCSAQTGAAGSGQGIQVPPTVIEVTGESLPISATSAAVVVLTREDIELAHAADLTELLDRVPFLHVAQNGSTGSFTSVTVRGGKPNFTLVLLDGTPLNDITNILGGAVDLSGISPDNIERIEIIRGPLSALYGSEAVSGVINIVTRSNTARSAEMSVEAGNFGTSRVALSLREGSEHAGFALGGSFFNVGEQVKSDAFSLGTLFGNFRVEGSKKVLELQARYQNDLDSSLPMNGGGPELSILQVPGQTHSGQVVFRAVLHQQVNAKWLYNLETTWFRAGERSNTPAILDQIPPTLQSVPSDAENTDFKRTEVKFSNSISLSERWTAHLNAGFKDEIGTEDGLLAGVIPERFQLDRPNINAGAEAVYSAGRLTASAGTGIDKSSGFNPHLASRAGINLRLRGDGTILRGTWGSAYQLPSMFALGNPVVGNPALRPEKNAGFDTGIEQKFAPWHSRISLTYFRNSFSDLIDFSATEFRLVNRTHARTQGAELEAGAALSSRIHLGGHVTYLDWKLRDTAEPLRDQPHWEGGIHGTWSPTQKLSLDLSTRWVGRRFDFQVPAPLINSAGGYSTTSFGAVYSATRRVSFYTRIDNVFNRRYHEFIGFPNPGIYTRIGIKYSLERPATASNVGVKRN